ncbi:hypothetical protein P280DRAFT_466450 [Massarina eburnea CBS 473.64]|uniref:Micro-fibrillar-associated protein 1 C-terminal domain-containing protein n=1 Tax=Massarina eburnea CBS 473.64 TaxID=1395130 RepID=A0A6A6SBB8_9PLEO|nr:hypothetical protein P280DRAFT_466450 [Massarina eburnea CBS 473.64]
MPPPSKFKKLTAQPVRTRHFVGKPKAAEVEQPSSSEESESEQESKPKSFAKPKPAPIASSFPKSALKSKLAARKKSEPEINQDDFETESEDEEEKPGSGGGSGSGSESGSDESSSEEEESSSEEEAPRKLLRPVFLKKNQRDKVVAPVKSADEIAADEERRREEQTRALVQAQIEQRAAEKAAGTKDWDDEVEEADINAVDDTDGLDPEAEYAAWKLRELKRIRRERLAIEEAEAERAEIERRRNLTASEREAEDKAYIEAQNAERGERGEMQFLQKYHHKGAFFQEELKELGVDQRRFMGARFEDETNREVLPEYMQIRDMTKLGKKGRTRYKDMKTEDTGTWGNYADNRRGREKGEYGLDERFRSDGGRDGGYGGRGRDGEGATGANAKPIGERKRFGEETVREGKRPRFDERD